MNEPLITAAPACGLSEFNAGLERFDADDSLVFSDGDACAHGAADSLLERGQRYLLLKLLIQPGDLMLKRQVLGLILRNLSLKFQVFRLQCSNKILDWRVRRLEKAFEFYGIGHNAPSFVSSSNAELTGGTHRHTEKE